MRVRVTFSVDVPDDYRRALAEHHGTPGLATREQIRDWYISHGLAGDITLEDIINDWAKEDWE